MRTFKTKDIVFLLILAIVFFSSSIIFLEYPGLGDEEAFLVEPAVSIINGQQDRGRYIYLFGQHLFLMTNAWVGPIPALLFVPSFYFFGISVYVIRVTRIVYGFITIVLLYFFAKEFFDKRTARIASFLLSTFPFYIFMYRQAYLDDGILPTFLLSSLLCFYKFYKTSKNKFLYLGIFFTGLGQCSKISFLWFIIAMIICFSLFKVKIKLNKRNVFISFIVFNIAILPMTLFNICNLDKINTIEHSTVGAIINNLIINKYILQFEGNAVNNLLIQKNILQRLLELKGVFRNWHGGERITTNPFYFYLLILTVVFYLVKIIFFRKRDNQIKVTFIIILLLIIFLLSCFTINTFRTEHVTIYLPLCMLVIANFLNDIFKKILRIFKYIIILTITCFSILALYDIYNILYKKELYQDLFKWPCSSSTINLLSPYLMNKDIRNPITLGPYLICNVYVLTKGKVQSLRTLHAVETYERERCYLEQAVREQDRYYLLDLYNKNIEEFERMLTKHSKTICIEKLFFTKTNMADIILFKLTDGKYNNELQQYLIQYKFGSQFNDDF